MLDDPLSELAPVDYVIVEFPAGAQNFTGEAADSSSRSSTREPFALSTCSCS